MATLDRWRQFLTTPKTLEFPRLALIGLDFSPPIVVGSGQVEMVSPTSFTFTLNGTPADINYALAQLRRQRENPYDGFARFRLIGTDLDGVEWTGGYTTSPVISTAGKVWKVTGEIASLDTSEQGDGVSQQAGTELIFLLRIGDPLTLAVTGLPTLNPPGTTPRREHAIEVLGSHIRFAYEDTTGTFVLTASQSSDLQAPYAENWLSEPLRIIFGQLIYPRLVARNFGDGRAIIQVRRSASVIRGARWAALCGGIGRTADDGQLWTLYAQLLEFVAHAHGDSDTPNFESHKLTRLYEEVIQAALGSRWVWALTFASSVEALAKMLIPKNAKPTENEAEAIEALVAHINTGPGESRLKKVAISAVRRTAEITTIRALRDLKANGVITDAQLSAWEKIRHAVMHGSLVSPYSTAEDDSRLLALSAMMHALTAELLRRSITASAQQHPQSNTSR
jgi:hypothetical protein